MLEDRLLELPQLRARLEAELVGEQLPAAAVGVERVGLPSRPVEGEHQLRAPPLSERVFSDERLELGHELCVPAELELGVDPLLERRGTLLLQLRALRRGRPSRRGRRAAGRARARAPPAAFGGASGVAPCASLDQQLEPLEIERAGLDA